MVLHSPEVSPGPEPRRNGNPFTTVANPIVAQEIAPPRHALADDPISPDAAWQLIHDELMLDGNARLNLATFVTTWMEPQATRLMANASTRT